MGAAGTAEHGRAPLKGYCLPDEMVRKIVDYVPRAPRELLALCTVCWAWRQAATRDELWEPICWQAVGGKPLLDRILGSQHPAQGHYQFYVQRRRALASYEPTLHGSSSTQQHQQSHTPPSSSSSSFSQPPPEGFFDPYVWVLELRDGEQPEERLLYACVLEMGNPQARGKLFTSAGASVVGQGIRLGVDVKGRLAPSPPSSGCSSPAHAGGSGTGDMASGAGAVSPPPPPEPLEGHDEEKDEGKRNEDDKPALRRNSSTESTGSAGGRGHHRQQRRLSSVADEAQEPPELVFRLWTYDRRTQRAACFVSTRLVTARPPGRWHGRHYDGPFSGPGGGPTTLVVLDDTHCLRVQPVVDMVDQFDSRVYLMAVRVDLQLCQCQGDEPADPSLAAYAIGGNWDVGGVSMWATTEGHGVGGGGSGGGCHCLPGSGLGMIPEEGTWILLKDLLATKLRWC